jgi:nicotinamide riboside transporter PnuC
MLSAVEVLEWTGSISGTIGAVLMARKTRVSAMAYPLWILSSLALMAFAFVTAHRGLLMQQACFTAINLYGFYRWVITPRRESFASLTDSADVNGTALLRTRK